MSRSLRESSLLNTVDYRSLSVGVVPSNEYLISTTVVGATPAASVDFDVSGLGDTYRHLKLVATVRSTRTPQTADFLKVTFNNDTTGYSRHAIYSTGSTPASYGLTDLIGTMDFPTAGTTANHYGAFVMDILDPFSTNKNTTVRFLGGTASSFNVIMLGSGLWIDTTAVASIKLESGNPSSNIEQYSRFSLYGVTA